MPHLVRVRVRVRVRVGVRVRMRVRVRVRVRIHIGAPLWRASVYRRRMCVVGRERERENHRNGFVEYPTRRVLKYRITGT